MVKFLVTGTIAATVNLVIELMAGWLLDGGTWNDSGVWDDDATWGGLND